VAPPAIAQVRFEVASIHAGRPGAGPQDGRSGFRADRFDIHTEASAPVPPEQRREAVMALLAERFNLSVHHETRDIPAMVLLGLKKPAGLKPAAAGET